MLRENILLQVLLAPKRGEVKESRRKLHNEESHILCSWLNVFGVIKSSNFIGRSCRTNLKNEKKKCIQYSGQEI
jgi:phosphoribosyl-dephospho-CoA transferase